MKYVLTTFLSLTLSLISAEIFEASHFNEIRAYLTPGTLVVLDIDDTLLIPAQTLGTDVWFLSRLQEHLTNGLSKSDALERAIKEWEGIRFLTEVKIVEEGTNELVDQLQSENYPVMALTTQGLALATCTIHQLSSLGFDLNKTAPYSADLYYMNRDDRFFNKQLGVLYRHGILFTSGTKKGTALLSFFERAHYYPPKVVFINDKWTHLKDVEEDLTAQGIEFIGLRYSYSDGRIENFNPDIARVQWCNSSFGHILSDEEAQTFLDKR